MADRATVGGALGSGFGNEVGLREAAYAYHPERDAQDEGPDSQD